MGERGQVTDRVRVAGAASPEEVAAVLAILHRPLDADDAVHGYERWRRQRIRALARRHDVTSSR